VNLVLNQPQLYGVEEHKNFFVGWPQRPTLEATKKHLKTAESIFAVSEGQVIGLVTALTDKAIFAFLPLLEVRPEFQRRGIGAELVKAMEDHLGNLYGIDLICDAGVIPFYKSLGFIEWTAMIKRNGTGN
jgi:ribosomal protein S18 acetylase RimI-like enzyme